MKKRPNKPNARSLSSLLRGLPLPVAVGVLVLLAAVSIWRDKAGSGGKGDRQTLGQIADRSAPAETSAPVQTQPRPQPKPQSKPKAPPKVSVKETKTPEFPEEPVSAQLPDPGPLVSAEPGEIRMADWNIRWFPSGRPEPQDAPSELATIRAAGKIVRSLEPTILCAEEIRDETAAKALAKAAKLRDFRLVVCSSFENYDGTAGLQQVAIFSIYRAIKTKCDRWHTVGFIDPPRGYAFALLDAPGGPVGVFAVHLKSNYVSPDAENPEKLAKLNRLKRELAARQVRELVEEWRRTGYVPKGTRFIVAGDFNTAEDPRWEGEMTLRGFREAGWRSCYEGVPQESRFTLPADPVFGYDAVTFDYIFVQGFSRMRATQVHPVPPRVSDHAAVTTLLR